MDSLKTLSLVILFILASLQASDEEQLIFTQAGHDCELQCQGPEDGEVLLLEWTRADLWTEDYVFLYRRGRVLEDYHHPSFSNRVQLRDPELKTGDLSVVLKRVTTQDSGRYRCSALIWTSEGREEISQDINLIVREPEIKLDKPGTKEKEGGATHISPELITGLTVTTVVLLHIIAGVCAVTTCRKKTQTQTRKNNPNESRKRRDANKNNEFVCQDLTPPQTEECLTTDSMLNSTAV